MRTHNMTLIELTVTLAILAAVALFTINYAVDNLSGSSIEQMRYEMKLIASAISGKDQVDGISSFVADVGAYPEKFKDLVSSSELAAYPNAAQWSGPYLFFTPQHEYVFDNGVDTFGIYSKLHPERRIEFIKPTANLLIDWVVDDVTLGASSKRTPIPKTDFAAPNWSNIEYNINDSLMAGGALFKCVAVNYDVDSTNTVQPQFIADYGRTFNDQRHLWQCIRPMPHEVQNVPVVKISPKIPIAKQTIQQLFIRQTQVGDIVLECSFDDLLFSDIHKIRLRPGMNYHQIPVRKRGN